MEKTTPTIRIERAFNSISDWFFRPLAQDAEQFEYLDYIETPSVFDPILESLSPKNISVLMKYQPNEQDRKAVLDMAIQLRSNVKDCKQFEIDQNLFGLVHVDDYKDTITNKGFCDLNDDQRIELFKAYSEVMRSYVDLLKGIIKMRQEFFMLASHNDSDYFVEFMPFRDALSYFRYDPSPLYYYTMANRDLTDALDDHKAFVWLKQKNAERLAC